MGIQALAAIIIVIAVAVGIIIAVTGSLTTGVIIAVVGFAIGAVMGIINVVKLWRNPSKMIPKFPKNW